MRAGHAPPRRCGLQQHEQVQTGQDNSHVIVPRRSALYVPGDKPRALARAADVDADCLIFDWEDAVAPAAKSAARQHVLEALAVMDYGHRERVIRVNDLATQWCAEDVQAAAAAGCDALLFPKIETPQQVRQAAVLVAAAAGGAMPIWLMAETPRAVLDMDAIAGAHSAVAVVVMGTSDLAEAMRVRPREDREPLLAALSRCVLAARANQLDILDGVHLDLNDAEALASVCAQGRDLGFDGKTLIHPRQVAAANRAFGVSDEEYRAASRLLEAWQRCQNQGQGVTVVDGRLVERLHADAARRGASPRSSTAARAPRSEVASPLETTRRSRMPVRRTIHSSEQPKLSASLAFETRLSGTWWPTPTIPTWKRLSIADLSV